MTTAYRWLADCSQLKVMLEYCIGSSNASRKGDHIAKIELAGIVGTKGHRGAFYSTTTQKDFANIEKAREWRHPQQSMRLLLSIREIINFNRLGYH